MEVSFMGEPDGILERSGHPTAGVEVQTMEGT